MEVLKKNVLRLYNLGNKKYGEDKKEVEKCKRPTKRKWLILF